jgi:prepilin-type N-terminal cleavage/methylation domain-containing protein
MRVIAPSLYATPRHGARRGAFTLIELLVVIAVISILVSLLLPALGRAKENSRRVKCLANLHGIGHGLQLYMDQEAKGVLLPKVRPLNSGSNSNDPSLLDVMSKYVDAPTPQETAPGSGEWIVSDPWKCPSDKQLYKQSGTSWEYPPGGLMLAAELFLIHEPQFGVSKAYEAHPTKLPILYDADDWHNPRFDVNKRDSDSSRQRGGADAKWDRNALFFGDLHAEQAPFFPTTEDSQILMQNIIKFGGGMG